MPVMTLHDSAMDIIKANWVAEPGIRATYLFPSADVIRIVHLDENSPALEPDEELAPFYFRAARGSAASHDVAVALIRPDEQGRKQPPRGWGDWKDAERIDRKD